jgi:hypothetical protein
VEGILKYTAKPPKSTYIWRGAGFQEQQLLTYLEECYQRYQHQIFNFRKPNRHASLEKFGRGHVLKNKNISNALRFASTRKLP